MVKATCQWLRIKTLAGMCRLLKRLGIHLKRGRDYVHSPDVDYQAKLAAIAEARQRSLAEPERYALLYLDEFSFYRQPLVALAYEERGQRQPLARRSHRSNTRGRVIATLDAHTGRVVYLQRAHITVSTLRTFWYELRTAYPATETLYVVLDNWPVHFHPNALAALTEQQFPWPRPVPTHWPTQPSASSKQDDLPIHFLCLPTYASWCNPIEKLWRWLTQEVLDLHRLTDEWPALKAAVTAFLDQFHDGSDQLLHYVGLSPY